MASLLPATIINAKGDSVPSSSLAGKVLGLYFSAHWCPPCRGFTPKLVEWFANFKARHAKKDQLELVFVSSDRDQASFDEYHHEMNFHALPFADRDAKVQYVVSWISESHFQQPDNSPLLCVRRA